MTYYIRFGSSLKIASPEALNLTEKLPLGTWTVGLNEMTGEYYLDKIDNLEFEGKVYGDAARMTERILDTFQQRDNATGVMLAGQQGSGKTLQAKLLSIAAREKGISTIVINEPHCGEGFNAFIQSIEEPTLIFFDEFEKVYDAEEQESMLTLLDGVYPSKKLFIITCNDTYRINKHMRNRPGRIYYRLDYQGLEQEFISEYCLDNLADTAYVDEILRISTVFSEFNFDILKALIEEMNRYGEAPLDALKILNAKPEHSEDAVYTFELTVDGKVIKSDKLYDSSWQGNPLSDRINIMYQTDGKDGWQYAKFNMRDWEKHDGNKFVFSNAKKQKLTLEKELAPVYSMANLY